MENYLVFEKKGVLMLLKTTHHLKAKAQYSCRSTTNFSTKFSIHICIEILTKFSTY
jgi:hypothetical protein